MPSLSLSDAELYYEEYGSGGDVVLSAQMELAQGESYQRLLGEAGFHVYYVQLRGFGKSSHVPGPPAAGWYPAWAEDVYQFAQRLGVQKFTYTGISHGGGIGWYLALAHPEALRALIAVVGVPHDRTLRRTRGLGIDGPTPPPMFEVPTQDPDRLRRRESRAHAMQSRWERQTPEERAIQPGIIFPELATNEEVAERLSHLQIPTLLLNGAQDDLVPAEMALRIARAVPSAKLVLYQDHSHSLASEAPERLIREVQVFISELERASV
jgi:pimeloyl-ACP methyl ester carboxylesterase